MAAESKWGLLGFGRDVSAPKRVLDVGVKLYGVQCLIYRV